MIKTLIDISLKKKIYKSTTEVNAKFLDDNRIINKYTGS